MKLIFLHSTKTGEVHPDVANPYQLYVFSHSWCRTAPHSFVAILNDSDASHVFHVS
jgi:hypothetical protein